MGNDDSIEPVGKTSAGEIMAAADESSSQIIIADITRNDAWIAIEQSAAIVPPQ